MKTHLLVTVAVVSLESEEVLMRKVVASEFVSMDGVVE
jgi:hypothetical protein